jgi:hypothetical protein
MKSAGNLILFFLCLSVGLKAQSYLKMGFLAGPTVSWASSNTQLSDGFFAVSRGGLSVGPVLAFHAGEHFFARFAPVYSRQNFAIRQTSFPAVQTDFRIGLRNIELPFVLGYSGFLGGLTHREYIGAGIQYNLSQSLGSVFSNGAGLQTQTEKITQATSYPVIMAGFEIGNVFKSDGALFFGGAFRYGFQDISSQRHTTPSANVPLLTTYNGVYLGIEITLYLPRFSYWFKREFEY